MEGVTVMTDKLDALLADCFLGTLDYELWTRQ